MWKTIDEYDNYEVNEEGHVRNVLTGRILKSAINSSGYYNCSLSKDCKQQSFPIHRLIALYFISNPDNLPCVDHINGNTLDNRIENLRWVTRSQNMWNRNGKGYRITSNGKYQAQITHCGKCRFLGTFLTPEEARQAYETKFIELRGTQYLR